MSLAQKFKQLEKLAIDNSPVLLTAIGVVGTVGTAILTHRAATKAERMVHTEERLRVEERLPAAVDTRERLEMTWKLYIPPISSGVVTVGAIVMANRIGSKRAAAIAAAYTITEKAYSEYREKVVEKLGENKERGIRDEIAKERMDRTPVVEREIIIASGDVLCYDQFTGRYFRSDMEKIRRAENDTNQAIFADGYQSLSDFYERIGLPATSASEEVGWTMDKMLTVEFSTHLSAKGEPCIAIDFLVAPVRDYHKFH